MELTERDKTNIKGFQLAGQQRVEQHWPDWREQINADELSMTTCCNCVLGQLAEGSYNRGLGILDLSGEEAMHLGFDLDESILDFELAMNKTVSYEESCYAEDEYRNAAWQFLQDCWLEALHAASRV